jgi:general secretion pathway protein D
MKFSTPPKFALLLVATTALTLTGSPAGLAQTPAPNSQQRITTNFKDADITTVAEAVAAATNRTFIVDPRVRAPVNLISGSPMTPQEFYQAFLSILQVHGFAAVPSGNVIKIIPDSNARQLPATELPDRIGGGGSDEMVTQVITVRNANAAQLVQVLKPLGAQYGHLASVPGSNTIIISDRRSNVERMMRIIQRVDQVGDANIEVIPLQNSSAADMVRTINALSGNQQAQEAAGIATRIVADDRSNSVLISGEPGARLRIATLIAHLDTPVADGGDTTVRYLRYADAEKIAIKLKEQLSGIAAASGGAAGAAAAAAAGPAADRNATIWAEPETNALVITASPKTMRSLKTIIDQLDIPRAQVLVEAIIVDVSTNKSADLGVNWAVFSREQGTNVPAGGFISPVAGTSIVNLAAGIVKQDPALAPIGATFGIGRLRDTGVSFAAMIRALRTDDNTNVIATPSATTLDNQETEIKVAQEVPFITGQYSSTGTGNGNNQVNPFTTVQRQEVGTILKLTPKINDGSAVVLKIELESSELSGQAGDANSLITNKRTINTSVMIEDGGVIVLGGLIKDSSRRGESRVPFLGRIPILGEAFKTRSGKRDKTNLMVFIRPTILRDGMQTSIATNRKYNAIRDEQIKQGPHNEVIPLLPFETRPQLPPAPPVPEHVTPPPTGPEGNPANTERTP